MAVLLQRFQCGEQESYLQPSFTIHSAKLTVQPDSRLCTFPDVTNIDVQVVVQLGIGWSSWPVKGYSWPSTLWAVCGVLQFLHHPICD